MSVIKDYREGLQECEEHGLTTFASWTLADASWDEECRWIPEFHDVCLKCEEQDYRKAQAEWYFYSVDGWYCDPVYGVHDYSPADTAAACGKLRLLGPGKGQWAVDPEKWHSHR